MTPKCFVAAISPAGSTRRVAAHLINRLEGLGAAVRSIDLADRSARGPFLTAFAEAGAGACLCIGSPVYKDLATLPVMRFIRDLPSGTGACAVPFVTWGGACSGIALWQMAEALGEKGVAVIGAAKVLAVHSMMWEADAPSGAGRPDAGDLEQVGELAAAIFEKLRSGSPAPLDAAALDYQPAERTETLKQKRNAPWENLPKRVDPETCTRCGECAELCPAAAIALDPDPVFDAHCFDCFTCVRRCPEAAIVPGLPMAALMERIRGRIKTIGETPPTRIFR